MIGAPEAMPAQHLRKAALSRREQDIAALVAQGLTNREIAQRLFLSERTVESHLEHVREKLDAKSRAQVAAWFVTQARPDVSGAAQSHPRPAWANPRTAAALAGLIVVILGVSLLSLWQITSAHRQSKDVPRTTVGVLKPVWSTTGGDHPLAWPGTVALGLQGAVYVLDRGHHGVQKLNSRGGYMTSWGGYGAEPGHFITECIRSCPPACTNNFDPALNGPCAVDPGSIATDRAGNVWVLDYTNRIQAFDPSGQLQSLWAKGGTGDGELAGPGSLAIDSRGDVVVSDARGVQRFSVDGRYVGQVGSHGNAAGQYLGPGPLAIDSQNNVYVIDWGCRFPCIGPPRILKFDSLGRSVEWAIASSVTINGPQVVAIGAHDNVWVLENRGNFIDPTQKLWEFDSTGRFLRSWSTSAFHYPFGLAIDKDGDAFITDLPHGAFADGTFEPNGRLTKVAPS